MAGMIRRLAGLLAAASLAACQPAAPPPSAVGGPFQLVDQNGRPATEQLLDGKWSAVFFGFTYCPDFCPTTLQRLQAAEAELGPRTAEKLQVIFVSVDPERDTPEALKAYLDNEAFPEGVVGLTGTPEQVQAVTRAYKAYAQKNGEGEDYLVDHSTAVYLMDPKGRFVRVLSGGQTPSQMAGQIRDAMRG
jgi:protein SCO1/2